MDSCLALLDELWPGSEKYGALVTYIEICFVRLRR